MKKVSYGRPCNVILLFGILGRVASASVPLALLISSNLFNLVIAVLKFMFISKV